MPLGLTREQFSVLEMLATKKSIRLQKEEQQKIQGEEEYHYLAESACGIMQALTGLGLIKDGAVTQAGLGALEPYRAKRAIFLAAGFGSRLLPVTINTPKPLVRVHGRRLIDGLIDACLLAGIQEIYIVRGYMSEQFDQLLYKYPMLRFLENPVYDEANNISSAMCARYLLQNAYVLEADLLVNNPEIIKPYHYSSNFLAIKKDETEDWCFDVKDGIITEEKIGGTDTWQMVGISYWDKADGRKLAEDIEKVYGESNGKRCYWEQVPLVYCKAHYQVEVRGCKERDVIEIDTLGELKEIDPAYGT